MRALLVDSSAWIEYLRDTGSRACEQVARLLSTAPGEVVLAPPITMELLAGAPDARALRSLEVLTTGLPTLPLDAHLDFHAAAAAYRAARAGGATVRSLVDCLIAVIAARSGAVLVHRDEDMEVLARCLPDLRTMDLRER